MTHQDSCENSNHCTIFKSDGDRIGTFLVYLSMILMMAVQFSQIGITMPSC